MNLLIVTNHFHPENFRINDLALSLQARGHKITVLTALPDYPHGTFHTGYSLLKGPYREKWEGIPVHRFPLLPRGTGNNLRLALQYGSSLLSSCFAALTLDTGDLDAIFVFGTSPLTIANAAVIIKKRSSAPLLCWVQDLWPESITAASGITIPLLIKPLQWNVGWIYEHCDRILYTSPGYRESILPYVDDQETLVYYPQWPEDFYQPLEPGAADPIEHQLPDGFRLMYAGNIGIAQGFDTIIEAATHLRDHDDIRWVILGGGRDRTRVEAEIKDRGLEDRFSFLGVVPQSKTPHYFAHADAMLISLAREDLLPLVLPSKLQSYMASGRPILAAAEGAVQQVLEESGAGFSSTPGDGKALAENVLQLRAMSSEEWHDMGTQGAEYCKEHFNKELLLDQLESMVSELQRGS